MSDNLPPSEYGGKNQRNTIQGRSPNGEFIHLPTSSEALRLTYLTGVAVVGEDDLLAEIDPMAFEGGEWAPEGYVYNRVKRVWEEENPE